MQITKEEALRRLNSTNNLANSLPSTPPPVPQVEYRTTSKVGKSRQQNIPEEVRDTIGFLAAKATSENKKSGQHQVIADIFGVSRQTVQCAASGKVGGRPANFERKAKVIDREQDIKDTALTKLMMTLGLISEEKLEDLDAKGLAQVGSHLAKVSQALTPQVGSNAASVRLVVYAPQMRDEGKYNVIDVG